MEEKKNPENQLNVEALIKENAQLRNTINQQTQYIRQMENMLRTKERINLLKDILAMSNKFEPAFVKNVREEVQYLINGFDPRGTFAKMEEEMRKQETEQTNENTEGQE